MNSRLRETVVTVGAHGEWWGRWERLAVLLGIAAALSIGLALVTENWVLLAPLLMAVLPILVRWPIPIALGLYAFLIPFDFVAALGEGAAGATLTRLVGIGVAGILLATGLLGRHFTRPPRAAVWWGIFILWGAVSAVWAVDSDVALGRLPTAISLFLLYVVAVSLSRVSERELWSVGALCILGGMIAALYVSFMYGQNISYAASGRASLILDDERAANPNAFAQSLLLPLALAIGGFVLMRGWWKKLLMAGAIVAIGGALYLTMSRGAVVAAATMILVYLYRLRVNWRILLPAAILSVLVLAMPVHFFERLQRADAGAGRLDIWRAGYAALERYGVLGGGLNNFPLIYDQYVGYTRTFQGYHRASHNIYLGTWVELGIFGLFCMMAAIISQLRAVWKFTRRGVSEAGVFLIAVEGACYGLLVWGMFGGIIWKKTFWFMWILLALAVSAAKRAGAWGPIDMIRSDRGG